MGAPKPALGYPSRSAASAALLAAGVRPAEIAERINAELPEGEKRIDASRVTTLASNVRNRAVWQSARPSEAGSRTVVIPRDVLDGLEPAAEARGVSVNKLVREIVAAVVDDDLVAAVLDDGGTE